MNRHAPARSSAPDLDPAHDPGFGEASRLAVDALTATPPALVGQPLLRGSATGAAHDIRVGTASWTDPTMVRGNVFYPRGVSSAADRLRYYAEQFPVVEVDSSYYSLPERAIALLWAERTPPHFSFHVKAHALMTGQPTEVARLPQALVDELPASLAEQQRIYAKDLPLELYDAVWEHFVDALSPLQESGKLGGILLQYPRWFLPTPANKDLLAASAARLAGIPATVELRNDVGGTEGTDGRALPVSLLRRRARAADARDRIRRRRSHAHDRLLQQLLRELRIDECEAVGRWAITRVAALGQLPTMERG